MRASFALARMLTALACLGAGGCDDPTLATTQTMPTSQSERRDSGPTKAIVVIISPDADVSRTRQVKQAFFDAVEYAEAHTRWHVIWGPDHRHIASFDIPSATGPSRFRQLRKVLPRLHAAFDQVDREADGQVDLPDLAAAVNKQLTSETSCQVAIYGSPRYLNDDQDAFQHNLVYVTKDGSVGHELSPFQTTEKLPKDCLVVWVTPQVNYGYDANHEAAIRHFNGYYIQELGGRLLRTTDDLSLMFDFHAPPNAELLTKKDDSPGKFAATGRRVVSGDETVQTIEFSQEDFAVPGDGVDNSPEMVLTAAEEDKGTIALAINWSSADPACDIDMWLASNGLAEELSFKNQEAGWGRHFRDVQTAATAPADTKDYRNWEWIQVDHARLHDLVLYLNVYRTTAPARVTIVRVWNGERKVRVIDLSIAQGDGGASRNNRRASGAWCHVALHSIRESDEPGTQ